MPHSARLGELLAVIGALVVFLALGIVVVSHGSQHADAVMDAEPAVNAVLGIGRVSFAHPQIRPGSKLAEIAPLYGRSLAWWLTAFGISAPAVMSMNCALGALTAFFLWLFVHRWQLIRTAWLRILFAATVPLITPVATIYRINRYDSFGMCGLAAACAALTVAPRSLRLALLMGSGFLAGSGGFHVIIGGGLLSLIALVFLGKRALGEFVAFNVGVAAGLAVVVGIIVSEGDVEQVRTALAQNAAHVARPVWWYLLSPIRGGQRTSFVDADLVLLAAAVIACVAAFRSWSPGLRQSAALFGLLAAMVIPIALACFGRYSNTYVWLAAVPTYAGAMIALDHEIRSRIAAASVGGLLMIAVLAGFPAHAIARAAEWRPQNRAVVEDFIAKHIRTGDVAYCHTIGYYPVKKHLETAFIGSAFHSMTPEQRAAVNLLILDGRENGAATYEPIFAEAVASLGGDWEMVAELTVPRGAFRSRLPPKPKSDCCYHVMLYRKRARHGD